LRKLDVVEPGVAWEIVPVLDDIHQKALDTIQKRIGRAIVNDGTALSWTTKKSSQKSAELGVASIKGRNTVDKIISESQLAGEWSQMDWFG
jgi:hypothetical protein